MSEIIDTMQMGTAIYGRCSVRAYRPEQVELPALQTLLAAAVRAPTAMHGESWQFVMGSAVAALNTSEKKSELGIPVEMTAIAPIIVGTPRGETMPSPRKQPQVRAWR
ncbi:nitroreductase family protein [Rhodoferax ferrireducens]|uniref:nitroreductase family protein n=1 Tax=Rhodoferax ferrireducens TaxID=192843 RepID=UPI00298E28D4|nr:nitroreductase family protein [Rhodoferax ferrireducens]WPC67840.1 nitroreductase family protein [Rhodoferax ferrireducens]